MQPAHRAALALTVAACAFGCTVLAAGLAGATPARCLLVGLVAYAATWAWTMFSQSLIAALSARRQTDDDAAPARGQESPQPGRE
ncbi:MAG: hypothetical protein ACE5O2_02000 [Armatimonadota bacterium]